MRFGLLRETGVGEARVALVPDGVRSLVQLGHQVSVEAGAGELSTFSDSAYEAVGAVVTRDRQILFNESDCFLKLSAPNVEELEKWPDQRGLICQLRELKNAPVIEGLKRKKFTVFAMEALPRITRAQSMDVLSSMSTVAGYKAVLLAAAHLPKFFPMLTTAAGTIRPAQGLILGAGVAGLQAIATARRLGALVEAFDTRPVVKEQVQSLGATFVTMPQQAQGEDKGGYAKAVDEEYLRIEQGVIAERAKCADFVIATALVPGRPAPCLLTEAAVAGMRPGSVVVDLAIEAGGNCAFSKSDQLSVAHGVTVLAPSNISATVPLDASRMWSRNLIAFIQEIVQGGAFSMDWENEIFRATCRMAAGEPGGKQK